MLPVHRLKIHLTSVVLHVTLKRFLQVSSVSFRWVSARKEAEKKTLFDLCVQRVTTIFGSSFLIWINRRTFVRSLFNFLHDFIESFIRRSFVHAFLIEKYNTCTCLINDCWSNNSIWEEMNLFYEWCKQIKIFKY